MLNLGRWWVCLGAVSLLAMTCAAACGEEQPEQCDAEASCQPGDKQVASCPPTASCYTDTICGSTITCEIGACEKPPGCAEVCLDLPGDTYCSIYQSIGNCGWSVEGAFCDDVFCPKDVPQDGQICSLETYVCSYSASGGGGAGGAGGTGGGGSGGEAGCATLEATCTADGWSTDCAGG